LYAADHKAEALEAFPQLRGRNVLLCVGRVDPVKNQGWVIAEAPAIAQRHPNATIVLAGPCTDQAYGEKVRRQISHLGLDSHVLLTGGIPPADPRLIGLFQLARAVVLPSISETFGLVIVEAWAAGTPTISSRTSGATSMIKAGENGWLFDLANPAEFHEAVEQAILQSDLRARVAGSGRKLVLRDYDQSAVGARVKKLYEELIEAKEQLKQTGARKVSVRSSPKQRALRISQAPGAVNARRAETSRAPVTAD
jgi:glycosyltransferase involved in cell wall biosynthesis